MVALSAAYCTALILLFIIVESVYKDECSVLQSDIVAMGAAEFKL